MTGRAAAIADGLLRDLAALTGQLERLEAMVGEPAAARFLDCQKWLALIGRYHAEVRELRDAARIRSPEALAILEAAARGAVAEVAGVEATIRRCLAEARAGP